MRGGELEDVVGWRGEEEVGRGEGGVTARELLVEGVDEKLAAVVGESVRWVRWSEGEGVEGMGRVGERGLYRLTVKGDRRVGGVVCNGGVEEGMAL
jgi:hypothetical protein